MKSFLVLVFIVNCGVLTGTVIDREWQNFQRIFGKKYASPKEMEQRYSTFKENMRKIRDHNSLHDVGNVTYRKGVNQFSDWTPEEFSLYVNKFELGKFNVDAKFYSADVGNRTIPEFVDWRLEGAVTEVRNQGHCGSCWAFSAVGALEGQAKLVLGKRVRLSEQNLVDCANSDYGNCGCDGGDSTRAFLYVQGFGIESEQTYPYVALQGKCRQTTAEVYAEDYSFVIPTEEDLKRAVATVGPISVAIDSTSELQQYSGGVFFDKTCSKRLNHAVLVVGYGVEDGLEYWLIKNSWGPTWGEQGYFRLARNKYNNCGVASYGSFPIVREGSH